MLCLSLGSFSAPCFPHPSTLPPIVVQLAFWPLRRSPFIRRPSPITTFPKLASPALYPQSRPPIHPLAIPRSPIPPFLGPYPFPGFGVKLVQRPGNNIRHITELLLPSIHSPTNPSIFHPSLFSTCWLRYFSTNLLQIRLTACANQTIKLIGLLRQISTFLPF